MLGEETAGMDEKTAAEQAVRAVERLRADIGIPLRLRDIGVQESQIPGFAEKAFGIKRLLRVNPRTASQADLEGILRAAY
jgi:alcohol dehydrogenase class IV